MHNKLLKQSAHKMNESCFDKVSCNSDASVDSSDDAAGYDATGDDNCDSDNYCDDKFMVMLV